MLSVPPLSLHHLTILDAAHEQLIAIAAHEKCEHVCVFVNVPEEMSSDFRIVESGAHARELRRRMDDAGVSVWNIEAFHIDPLVDPETLRPSLEIGAILGGRGTTVINTDLDPDSAASWLARFGEIAQEYGLVVGLEWIKPSATRTLPAALDLVRRTSSDNVKLTVDPLHFVRNGGKPADLASLSPDDIGYVQFCDGPLEMPEDQQWPEMIGARLVPGEGEFPLVNFLGKLPKIPVLAIEVPQRSLHGIVEPEQRAAKVVAATRSLVSTVIST